MSGGVTTNYGLKKPNFNARPWDSDINGNFDLIDAILFTITQIPNIGGVWRNSTQYIAGQNVLDAQSLTFYQCVVSNVSAATGLFADDRAANPANWTVTSAGQGVIRYDQGQVLTAGQIQQALTNISTLSNAQMIAKFLQMDAAQTLTSTQMLQALTNIGLIAGQLQFSASQYDYLRTNVLSGIATLSPAGATTLQVTDIEKPVNVTGTTTITMPAAANSWRSGVIRNANPTTGVVTLAVPNGATLDGVVNGTTVLLPFQKARIIQTGTTAYITDWVDREPILFVSTTTTNLAAVVVPLCGYALYEYTVTNIRLDTNNAGTGGRISSDGTTFRQGANDYYNSYLVANNAGSSPNTPSNNFGSSSFIYHSGSYLGNDARPGSIKGLIYPGSSTQPCLFYHTTWMIDNNNNLENVSGYSIGPQITPVAYQIFAGGGNFLPGLSIRIRGLVGK